jgi:hypothetical protein
MVDLCLTSRYDGETRLRRSLEGSLPGLKVWGPVLEGLQSVEGRRQEVQTGNSHRRDPLDPPVLRDQWGKRL